MAINDKTISKGAELFFNSPFKFFVMRIIVLRKDFAFLVFCDTAKML